MNAGARVTCRMSLRTATFLVLTRCLALGLAGCGLLPPLLSAPTATSTATVTVTPSPTNTPAPSATPTFVPYIPEWPILRRGQAGAEVFALQRLLRYRGFVVVVDGRFGEQTEDAVRVVQSPLGEPVSGLVGPVTWTALVDGVVIQEADSGEAVRAAEYLLNKFRDPVTVNGTFEPRDAAALRVFEAAVGLQPDGVIDEPTWRALVAIKPSPEPSLSYP